MTTATKLDALKQTLLKSRDLLVPWHMFHDDFAMDPAFMQEGFPDHDTRIEACLAAIGGALIGEPCKAKDPGFLHLPEHHFWHGSCQLGSRLAIFFHFDDIDVGLAGLLRSPTDSRVELARLSVVELPEGSRPGVRSIVVRDKNMRN